MIRTKDKRLVPFEPNAVQRRYLEMLDPGWESRGYPNLDGKREIILKARQFGFSTLIAAAFFCDVLNSPNSEAAVISHDAKSTDKLFAMIRRMWENLPDDVRPSAKYASRSEFYWPEIGSSYYVGTAGTRSFGRGTTLNRLHGSEVSSWPNAEELVAGLMEAVPMSGTIFLESTAKGLGNYYHEEYTAAQEGESVFVPRFFAWFEHDEYRVPVTDGLELTETGANLKERFGLDDAQVAFYQGKAKALRGKVVQEYPSDAEEAFLSSGDPVFDRARLNEMKTACRDAGAVEAPAAFSTLAKFRPSLKVWTMPQAGRRYVIGADPAEGIKAKGADRDFSSLHVLDAETWEVVAVLHGRIEPHWFGLCAAELGRWYGTALLVIERNNHGHAVLSAAIHTAGYPLMGDVAWGGVYTHEEFDERKRMTARRPGWPTTVKTKAYAVDCLNEAISDGDLAVCDLATIGELMRFVHLPGGKMGGESGSHDDRATSLAMAVVGLRARPVGGWANDPDAMKRIAERLDELNKRP